jgi:signal transduction histidine kinase
VTEAGRLRRRVGEILDAAWAGRPPEVQREPVDLAELARESARRVPGAQGRVTIEAEAPLVGAFDGERIRQLLDNLVDNAIKYSPSGAEVTVRVERVGEAARVTVADHGIGVPAGDLPRLFERFHRGSNVDDRRFRGLGLGLAISRRIVEQHGGTIAARSEVGVGTTIEVTLPLHLADRGPGSDGDGPSRPVDGATAEDRPAAESTHAALGFAPGDV